MSLVHHRARLASDPGARGDIYTYIWYPPPGPTLLYFSAVFTVNYAHFDIDFWVQVLDHFLVEGIVGVPHIYIYIDTIRTETVVNEDLLGGNQMIIQTKVAQHVAQQTKILKS